ALGQMDEVTQQNSAMVEENAATAKTLEAQATIMDGRVRSFKTSAKPQSQVSSTQVSSSRSLNLVSSAPVPKAVVQQRRLAGARRAGGAARSAAAERAHSDPDWKEF